jgi:hypothetical protein
MMSLLIREIKKYDVGVASNSNGFVKVYLEIDQLDQALKEGIHKQTDIHTDSMAISRACFLPPEKRAG